MILINSIASFYFILKICVKDEISWHQEKNFLMRYNKCQVTQVCFYMHLANIYREPVINSELITVMGSRDSTKNKVLSHI